MNNQYTFFGGIFVFSCIATILGILFGVYRPIYSEYAGLIIVIGFFDMVLSETNYVCIYFDERRELQKREAEKTWIDKALEGGI